MKLVYIYCFAVLLSWPLVGAAQTAQWTEKDWQPLVDEPSRQDLLRSVMNFNFEINSAKYKFQFPADAQNGGVYGIDLSHHSSSNIAYAQLAANGVRYVYVKATQGVTFMDPKFAEFWTALDATPNVLRGAYHFLSATTDPEDQAERFVAYVNLHGGFKADDLPPVVDLEWDKATVHSRDRWRTLKPSEIVNRTLKFMARVKLRTGRMPMIYTSQNWWHERGFPSAEIARLTVNRIWVADYSDASFAANAPNFATADLWQFTDKSELPNTPAAEFDANVFQGTFAEFMQTFAK